MRNRLMNNVCIAFCVMFLVCFHVIFNLFKLAQGMNSHSTFHIIFIGSMAINDQLSLQNIHNFNNLQNLRRGDFGCFGGCKDQKMVIHCKQSPTILLSIKMYLFEFEICRILKQKINKCSLVTTHLICMYLKIYVKLNQIGFILHKDIKFNVYVSFIVYLVLAFVLLYL